MAAESRNEETEVGIDVAPAVLGSVKAADFVDVVKVDRTAIVEENGSELGPGMTGMTTVSVACDGLTTAIDGVKVEATVSNTVVVTAGSVITTVDATVCVSVSNTVLDIVTVSTLSELCVTVRVTVAGARVAVTVVPPSTGTTEYGTRFCFSCALSGFCETTGRAVARMRKHAMTKIDEEKTSFIANNSGGQKWERIKLLVVY
ncbi:hypothetical protein MMC34_007171 [Xylographa carneopallida]|nr:hypothetical protein [Xylographa carneopallida]